MITRSKRHLPGAGPGIYSRVRGTPKTMIKDKPAAHSRSQDAMGPRLTNNRGKILRYENAPYPPRSADKSQFCSAAEVYISFAEALKRRIPIAVAHSGYAQKRTTNRPALVVPALAIGELPGFANRLPRYANSAPIPAPTRVTTTHQPKTTPMHVPRLTRVTHE